MKNRNELKRNIISSIILRVDYEGLMDIDLDNLIVKIRELLKEEKYLDSREIYKNELEFLINPNSSSINDLLRINPQPTLKVYEFIDENKRKIQISRKFFICELHIFEEFEKYSKIMCHFMENAISDISLFKIKRLGLRKVNVCYVLEQNSISKYFKNLAIVNQPTGYKYISSNIDNLYESDNFKIKLSKNIQTGKISDPNETKEAFQIILDIDVFSQTFSIFENLKSEKITKIIDNLNNLVFTCFTNEITDKLYELLCKEHSTEKDIIGINSYD